MSEEEYAELTPSGNAGDLARQLLAVASDLGLRPDVVRTTTTGPRGLAFVVPLELHAAWEAAYITPVEEAKAAEEPVSAPKRRGRPSTRTDSVEKE